MKQDLMRLTVASLSLGVIVWAIYGNPESRAHKAQSVRADSSLSPLTTEDIPEARSKQVIRETFQTSHPN
jgi:hypothetical protein